MITKLIVTSKNNLMLKNIPLKGAEFFGREKAIPQLTRQLGIRTSDYHKYKEQNEVRGYKSVNSYVLFHFSQSISEFVVFDIERSFML